MRPSRRALIYGQNKTEEINAQSIEKCLWPPYLAHLMNQNSYEKETQALIGLMQRELQSSLPKHSSSQIYDYILIPPGKLFRPLLISQLALDLNPQYSCKANLMHLMAAIEMHHAYTLVHDDLPCMDDDDIRRDRPSAHKKFNEWQALLAGDGLLNLSYAQLAQIESKKSSLLFKIFSKLVGPKGLIFGQVLDLSQEMTKNFESLLLTHELKTARLLQASTILCALLVKEQSDLKLIKSMARFGKDLGIAFQLLDDLQELTCQGELSPHEKAVNPWPRFYLESKNTLTSLLEKIQAHTKNLPHTKSFLKPYWQKNYQSLVTHQTQVQEKSTMIEVDLFLQLLRPLTD